MTEGIVRIYLSYVEPEDKNLLWMRPYLNKEGYELLYFGAKGWTKWLPCCKPEVDYIEDTSCEEFENDKPQHPIDREKPCGCS